ncbi:MAG: uracil-DNA glycosylase [Pyrinomonadaceae bacterium]
MASSTKRKEFERLVADASVCAICPELADKAAVMSELNGCLSPKVLFVAEAPGRQGADRTRRPFWGDKSGENFQVLLDSIGLRREEIFITNSVMCSPRKPSGANRRPKTSEIRNCSAFLKRTIELINPPVVATLGTVALGALEKIEPHGLVIRDSVGKSVDWMGRRLVPLYHPSPQVIAAVRRLEEQVKDYRILGELAGKLQ